MSQKKGERRESPLEFKHLAKKIHRTIVPTLERNFDLDPAEIAEHAWLLEKTKGEIIKLADALIYHIETANALVSAMRTATTAT